MLLQVCVTKTYAKNDCKMPLKEFNLMAVAWGAACPVSPGSFTFLALYPSEEVISPSHNRDLSCFNLSSSWVPTCSSRKGSNTMSPLHVCWLDLVLKQYGFSSRNGFKLLLLISNYIVFSKYLLVQVSMLNYENEFL